nr:DUF3710 domain-containing protein [Streptomyces sp. S1D4-11]QIY92950.1 DUF3710 domain-containing protein [Streptomyces sp. S1D4-11]
MKDEARAILRQFEQGEPSVSEDGRRTAAAWDHVSPTAVIAHAYGLWVHEKAAARPGGGDRLEEVVRGLFPDADGDRFAGTADDAVLLTRGLLGDFDAGAEADAKGLGTLYNLAALLHAAMLRSQLSGPDLEELLARAEAEYAGTLVSGELARGQVRDGHVGPWDVTEVENSAVEGGQIDFGALRVPVVPGVEIRPEGIDAQGQGDDAYGITLRVGGSHLQLQLFSAPEGGLWDWSLGELAAKIEARGGEVREITGQLGTEIRSTIPAGGSGSASVAVRFVGCDGPGWMLRGVLTGPGADSDILQEQVRRIFLGTVVDIRDARPLPNGLIALRWPPLGGWNETDTPLFD